MKGVTLTDYAQSMLKNVNGSGGRVPHNPGTGEGIYPLHVRHLDNWTVTVATDDGLCDVVYGWRGETPVILGWLVGRTEDGNPVTTPVMDEILYIEAAKKVRGITGQAPGRMDLI